MRKTALPSTMSNADYRAMIAGQLAPAETLAEEKTRDHPEDDLQRALVRDLKRVLAPCVIMAAVPNGGKRGKIEAARQIGLGVLPGFPDLIFLWSGHIHCLELKAPHGGRLSEAQKKLHPRLTATGIGVDVVRSLDEALTGLKAAGVPLRIKN